MSDSARLRRAIRYFRCSRKQIEARHFTTKLEQHFLIEQMSRFGEDIGIFRLSEQGREYVVREKLH